MLRDADEIRRVFANAGWNVTQLRERAFRSDGREHDLTTVQAAREALRASGYVLRDFAEGDSADRWITHGASRTRAVRCAGGVKTSFEVSDFGRASALLQELMPLLGRGDVLRSIGEALAVRGWHVVDDGRSASADWDFSWQIVAERAGESLVVGVACSTGGGEGRIRESLGGTAMGHLGAMNASVTLRSAAEANALVLAVAPSWSGVVD